MASHIQVVLRQDVENLGTAGALVRVRPGFARNYLMPRGMAAPATGGNVRQVEHQQRAALALAAKLRDKAEALAMQVEGLVIEIAVQVGEGDKLYGSIGTRDVAEKLAAHGIDIDRKRIQIPDAIKELGEYDLTAKFGNEVSARFRLLVTPQ